MSGLGEVLVVAVALIGVLAVAVQVVPLSSLIVLAPILLWSVVTGGTVGWTVGLIAVGVIAVAEVATYLLAGRYLSRSGVPKRTIIVAALVGVVGFFVIPVVGLPLGFVLAVYLLEQGRVRESHEARRATWLAMKAVGLAIVIELAGVLSAVAALIVGMIVA